MSSKVLILYPALFKSLSKFQRKVGSILSSMTEFSVVHRGDFNQFIEDTLSGDKRVTSVSEILQLSESDGITHSIIFDDGEEFNDEVTWLKLHDVKLRIVHISITRIVNIRKDNTADVYIGRGSYWGNPYSMEEGDSREEVIRKFKYDFDNDKFPNIEKSKVYELRGKRLGCYCKPAACHGDVLADYLNSYDDGK